jgi:hypothetical protein
MSKKGVAPWKLIGLIMLVAAPVILFAGGCDPECVDDWDCLRAKGSAYICTTGKCVQGTRDSGTP